MFDFQIDPVVHSKNVVLLCNDFVYDLRNRTDRIGLIKRIK